MTEGEPTDGRGDGRTGARAGDPVADNATGAEPVEGVT